MFYRLNADSNDLKGLQDAKNCIRSVRDGDSAYGRSMYEVAREHYSEAIKYAENSAALLLKRSWCHYHNNDLYGAIADTGKVLKLENDHLEALELRGTCYYVLGELEMAMNHYRLGLKSDPENPGCKNGYRLLKSMEKFKSKYEKAIASKDYEAAVKSLEGLIKVDPEHPKIAIDAYIKLASALIELKEFERALMEVKKAIAFDDKNAHAYRVQGRIFMEQENFEEAVRSLKTAADLSQGGIISNHEHV
jgi:DnaJ family protein C protein 3